MRSLLMLYISCSLHPLPVEIRFVFCSMCVCVCERGRWYGENRPKRSVREYLPATYILCVRVSVCVPGRKKKPWRAQCVPAFIMSVTAHLLLNISVSADTHTYRHLISLCQEVRMFDGQFHRLTNIWSCSDRVPPPTLMMSRHIWAWFQALIPHVHLK